jgi:hypothetical protein
MKILKVLSLTAIVFLLTQCYPEGPQYVDELDLVYSNYDPAYDFAVKPATHTYFMPDKIMKIDDDLVNGGGPNFVNDTYAKPMLNMIIAKMSANGWTPVGKDENPDVLLAPVAYMLTTTYYYGGYWGGYYGGWYGWYYPYPVTTSYTTGSLVVTMLNANPADLSPDDKLPAVWGFIVNGLLEGSASTFTSRYTKGIDQAFTQSPYLKIN